MDGKFYFGWQDTRKIPLTEKILCALRRYEEKFGKPPSVLEIGLNEGAIEGLSIGIQRRKYIPVNTFYIGELEDKENTRNES